ncbi:aldo/keto reductase [Paraburkholderia solisilvae]|uniref:2,5-diketo-D-gluconic acid reductase B n=1 Tax=Paraburkholderia solisilvae TaxID=624376 RepID=A0A6J5DS22_9BURK|nr:aldo/keto reductase [Paraburkholderia solisilvae]CAB3755705.1 2,5-diketo-D-gluconic acid reductase B [Paraburkholderia solisilvae]
MDTIDTIETIETQGIRIPRLGFGTFRMPGADCQPVVESALALGYRHIDTATMYQNEEAVGAALASAGLARDTLHITTKAWHDSLQPDALRRSFDSSLQRLRLDYVDLFMVHWPAPDMNLPALLETMQKLREEGRTRAIGVCNFTLPMLKTALDDVRAPLACVQVEYHPFLSQAGLLGYLRPKGIPLVAYAPLAQGRAASDPVLAKIGAKHDASAAQIALAWLLDQDGVMAIPKARRKESQQSNLGALKVRLDDEDRRAIAALPKDQRYVSPPCAPEWDA